MLYFLNEDLAAIGLCERVLHLVWERRCDGAGKVSLLSTEAILPLAERARYLFRPDCAELAVIDSLSLTKENRVLLEGRSAEALLADRVLEYGEAEGGFCVDVLRDLIEECCGKGERGIRHFTVDRGEIESEDAEVVFEGADAGEELLSLCVSRLHRLSMRVAVTACGEKLVCRIVPGRDLRDRVELSENFDTLLSLDVKKKRGVNVVTVLGQSSEGEDLLLTVSALRDGERRVEGFVDKRSIKRSYRNRNGLLVTRSEESYRSLLRHAGEAALSGEEPQYRACVREKAGMRYREDYDIGDRVLLKSGETGSASALRILAASEEITAEQTRLTLLLG